MRRNTKEQKGITLIALVVTIIILLILTAVSMNMVLGDQGILTQAQVAANQMHDTELNTQESFNALTLEMEQTLAGTQIPDAQKEQPNPPEQIAGMTPIKFTEPTSSTMGSVEETNWSDDTWYDYSQKKWANTKSADGSMWVWIPRYAYKITYKDRK